LSVFVVVKKLIQIQQTSLFFVIKTKLFFITITKDMGFIFITLFTFISLILLLNRRNQIIQLLIEADSFVLLTIEQNGIRDIIVHCFLPDLLVVLSVEAFHKVLVVEDELVLYLVVDIGENNQA